MKKTPYKTATFKTDHTTYGGLIYPSDFNTDHNRKVKSNGSAIASRIVLDKKFDRELIKNRKRHSELQSKTEEMIHQQKKTEFIRKENPIAR